MTSRSGAGGRAPRAVLAATAASVTSTSVASKTAAVKRTAAKKTAVKKTAAKKTADKKTAAKKPAVATAGVQAVTTKSAPKKVAPKKVAPKKVAPKKVAPKKVAPKQAASSRAVATEAVATEAVATEAVAKKTVAKQAVAKQAVTKQSATKPAVATKAAPPSLKVRENESPWTAAELREVRAELESDIHRLGAEIALAESGLHELLRDSGDGAGDDSADAGAKTFEREQEISLANNSREMLEQSGRALAAIDDGTYGVCESCGLPVGKMRLQAFPRATLCVSCKSRQERR